MLSNYKEQYAKLLQEALPLLDQKEIQNLIELPPPDVSADFAFPCFQLAKKLQKSPQLLAQEIATKCQEYAGDTFSIEAVGPYVNATIGGGILAQEVLKTIELTNENYGKGMQTGKVILVESPGPNTNKPLHLGHVRNMLLGNALVNILRYIGHTVYRVDIINDRGVHICKSMLAYQRFKNNVEPDKKGDHFVGDCYVEYARQVQNDPTLETAIHDMLRAWEAGDEKVRALRKKMNDRAITGIHETYRRYGTFIDKTYYEHAIYLMGKEIVLANYEKGIFTKDEKGNIVFKSNELPDKKVVLRADGTTVYITQDIALMEQRFQDRHPDAMIYVVGNEQIDHFKALFAIARALGYPFADKCYHLAYGMISLPTGRMKSREGTVVDADTLADKLHDLAYQKVCEKRPNLNEEQKHEKAETIAMGAIKFFILNYEPEKNFVFDPTKSLAFEGETGPYIQYTHARCCSLLQKYEQESKQSLEKIKQAPLVLPENFSVLDRKVLVHLAQFPDIIQEAATTYKPSILAKYLFNLAQTFNTLYTQTKILTDNQNETLFRVRMTACSKRVLANGLGLLGIQAPHEM